MTDIPRSYNPSPGDTGTAVRAAAPPRGEIDHKLNCGVDSCVPCALAWALDMLDLYDQRLSDGGSITKSYTATHVAGKAKARGALAAALRKRKGYVDTDGSEWCPKCGEDWRDGSCTRPKCANCAPASAPRTELSCCTNCHQSHICSGQHMARCPDGTGYYSPPAFSSPLPTLTPEVRGIMLEAADEIEASVRNEYNWPDTHPAMQRKYDRDIEIVGRLRRIAGREK